jgi:hypothetical protein
MAHSTRAAPTTTSHVPHPTPSTLYSPSSCTVVHRPHAVYGHTACREACNYVAAGIGIGGDVVRVAYNIIRKIHIYYTIMSVVVSCSPSAWGKVATTVFQINISARRGTILPPKCGRVSGGYNSLSCVCCGDQSAGAMYNVWVVIEHPVYTPPRRPHFRLALTSSGRSDRCSPVTPHVSHTVVKT